MKTTATQIRAFGAIAASIRTATDDRRNEVCSELADALAYIGQKSGQDQIFRNALDRIEREAPRGKKGSVSPSATRLLNAARNALTAGKLAYSRVQVANKITDPEAWGAECGVIVAEFRANAWIARATPAIKVEKSALEKVRAAVAALTDGDRAALFAELKASMEPAEAPAKAKRQRKAA